MSDNNDKIDEMMNELEAFASHFDSRLKRTEERQRIADRYKVPWGLAPGQSLRSGKYAIEGFEIEPMEAIMFNVKQSRYAPILDRSIMPGRYTRLIEEVDESEVDSGLIGASHGIDRKKPYKIWMSDTCAEVWEHMPAIEQAKARGGHCLVTGLGIGMVANAMLMHGVETVTIIEINANIATLVAPLLIDRWGVNRIEFFIQDAFGPVVRPPRSANRYSVAWHDIWPDISSYNLGSMAKIMSMYEGISDWQGCWAMDQSQKMAYSELCIHMGDMCVAGLVGAMMAKNAGKNAGRSAGDDQ